jgi:hypothetical protein
MYWGEQRCIQDFGGKPEEERPLGRPRHRWEDNIEMDLQEVGWGVWTGLIWFGIGVGGGLLLRR